MSLAAGETQQRFGNREQPQGSEIKENFLLPLRLPRGLTWENWKWKKPLSTGRGNQWPGDIGDSLSSSHQAPLQVPMALQSLLSLCPLPWLCPLPQGWGIRPEGTTEGPSASPHHSSPAEPLPRAGVSMKSSLSWRLLLIPKGPLGSAWLPECSWAGLVGAAARHWHINAPS